MCSDKNQEKSHVFIKITSGYSKASLLVKKTGQVLKNVLLMSKITGSYTKAPLQLYSSKASFRQKRATLKKKNSYFVRKT